MKKLKEEKGSITLFVIVSMLFFVLVLAGVYMISSARTQAGISETKRIKEIYEKEVSQIDSIYVTLDGEPDLPPIEDVDPTYICVGIKDGVLSYYNSLESAQASNPDKLYEKVNEMEYQATQELRNEVIFRQFNLMNPFPFKRPFHVVFLRNVMIYFDEDTKLQLLRKIYDYLEPGGYLFIGTTEALNRKGTAFKYVEPSIYQK